MGLVLTRMVREEVVIQDGHGKELGRVQVSRIEGDRVRLRFDGFEREMGIHRAELLVKKSDGPAGGEAA